MVKRHHPSTFTVTIGTDNAAFEDMSAEIARILRTIAKRVSNGDDNGTIFDANGNSVGRFELHG